MDESGVHVILIEARPDIVPAVTSRSSSSADFSARALESCALKVRDLCVRFEGPTGPREILKNLTFQLAPGEIGSLLGASGCGKTPPLRAIAGFLQPWHGEIMIGSEVIANAAISVAPEHRGVGVVFQDYALFPHLTLARNVAFGLTRMSIEQRNARVGQLLEMVGLSGSADRYPHELSGGQQQRVALARALAPSPSVLLLDEPFSSLDPDLREQLALDLRELLKSQGTTALLVTHDQYEAFAMADSIGVMEQGRIAQWDDAWRLYHQPGTRSVADFVGQGVFMNGRLQRSGEQLSIEFELGSLPIHDPGDARQAQACAGDDGRLQVLLRPDDVEHDDESPVQARVLRRAFRGAQFLYTLELASGQRLLALVPSHHDHRIGDPIGIRFTADHIVTFACP
ncbi:MAG: ABC transporter ATP-binding protein [Burkholderiaceae bacterium]